MPVIAYDLLESVQVLAAATRNFVLRCVTDLQANRSRVAAFVEQSLAMGTALATEIGYERAAALVKEAYRGGKTVREVAIEESGITSSRIAELLDPRAQTGKK
jgi:fumarate hydratase, class II